MRIARFLGRLGVLAWTASLSATVASAATISFDDVTEANLAYPVPAGYGGLDAWTNVVVLRHEVFDGSPQVTDSGYAHGAVSSPYVAGNYWEGPAEIHSASPWTLHSAYVASAWKIGAIARFEGYVDGNPAPVYSREFRIDATGPLFVQFDFAGINRLWFLADKDEETTNAGYGGIGDFLVLDDMTVTVPEPSVAVSLAAFAIAVALGWSRTSPRHPANQRKSARENRTVRRLSIGVLAGRPPSCREEAILVSRRGRTSTQSCFASDVGTHSPRRSPLGAAASRTVGRGLPYSPSAAYSS